MAWGSRCLLACGVFVACTFPAGCAESTTDGPRDLAVSDLAVSDTDGAMPADLGPPSVAQACADFAMAFCTKTQTCYPGFLKATYGDLATCLARRQLDCPYYFTAPGTSLTPTRWEGCAQAVAAETCDQYFSYKLPVGCQPEAGALVNGDACLYHDQCVTGRCNFADSVPCGTCRPIQPTGGSCNTSDDCASTDTCSSSHICIALVGAGAVCDATHVCDNGYHCNGSSCVANVAVNGACTTASDCAYYLDCIDNTCQDGGFAAPGAPCGHVTSNSPWVYCSKGSCTLDSGGQMGTCTAKVDDGASCVTTTDCVPPAYCFGNKCTILDPTDPSTCL